MKRFSLLMMSFIIINTITYGQENEKHIEKTLINLEKLITKGNFANGYIYLPDDTLKVNMLTYKGRKKMNYNLFCVCKNNNDSIKIYRPKDIVGYKINNTVFISHDSDGDKFFMKQLKLGRINLYERVAIPSDNRFLYFMQISRYPYYFIINPFENNITEQELPSTRRSGSSIATETYFQSKGVHEKFKLFIYAYLGDCEEVTNMVKSEFYTISDTPGIVETYNKCFK